MKKFLPFVVFLVLTSFVSGQTLMLKFAGRDSLSQQSIALDSVFVKNATKDCDTIIYGSVPSLSMNLPWSVGISNIKDFRSGGFRLDQNYPNPFNGTTNVNIFKECNGQLNLKLFDGLGRKLAEYQNEFEKGSHILKISSSGYGLLVLQVSDHNFNQSIKIISTGRGQVENTIQYLGLNPDAENSRLKSEVVPDFIFHWGDQMIYKIYAEGYKEKTLTDTPTSDRTYILNLSKLDLPTVTTSSATNITTTTATLGGNVVSDGGYNVTIRGVCWGTTINPNVTGNHTLDGTGTGTFVSHITGLTEGTLYYVRAYATNSIGTAYGNEIQFGLNLAPKAMISFIWDGCYDSHEHAYAIHQEYGLIPSFALITGNLTDARKKRYINYAHNGCSILAHSRTWLAMNNPGLITYEQVRQQMILSKSDIEALGIACKGWVTPGSVLDESFFPLVSENFNYGFDALNNGGFDNTVDPLKLNRLGIESSIHDSGVSSVLTRIDVAIANNQLLVLYSHEQPSSYFDGGIPYVTDAQLREVLAYIKLKVNVGLCYYQPTDSAISNYYKYTQKQ